MIKRAWIVNMGITLGFILLVWVLDILFHINFTDYYHNSSSLIFSNNNSHEVFIQILIAIIFLVFGVVLTMKSIRIRRSEQELMKKTEQYRLIAEYSNDVIWKMNLAVKQVIKDIEMENPENRIQWKIHELGKVNADPGLIKQLWHNLISNSVKFSRNQSFPRIEIGKTKNNNKQSCYIKDNGAGFDSRYMDKLFGVFQRLHTDNEFEGSGIGLATVKRIVDRHRGSIWAESSPGNGAVFFFYLS